MSTDAGAVREVSARYLEEASDVQRVPAGYKQTEVGMIPEDWAVCSVLDVTVSHKQGYYTKDKYVNRGVRLVRITDLHNPEIDYESMPLLSVPQKDFEQYRIRKGDFLFARSGAIGRYGVVEDNKKAVFGSYIIRFNFNEDRLLNKFFGYLFETEVVWKQLLAITQGSSNININANNIKALTIPLPKTKEQHAIAAALSDVDALIAALDKLIAKKRAIKTAAMQQLLTGKQRLPGFEREKGYKQTEVGVIPEDWSVARLGECLARSPEYGINAPAVAHSDSLPTYIRITDISDDGRFSPDTLVSVDDENSSKYFLEDSDLVFARTGASVGKSYLYDKNDGALVFAGFLIRIRPDQNKLVPAYLANYVTTSHYWAWITLMSMRSGQPGVNGKEYAQLRIPLPSPKEQTAIATILSDMDAEIAALETRRDKTRALKQGMMQELLTGRTRLI